MKKAGNLRGEAEKLKNQKFFQKSVDKRGNRVYNNQVVS